MIRIKQNNHFLFCLLLASLIASLSACSFNRRLNKVSEYEIGDVENIVVQGDFAYLANGHNGFGILDVSNPLSPTVVSQYPLSSYTQEISISSKYAFVVNQKLGLYIFDVSDPTSPNLIGNYDKPGNMISIHDDHAYYITSRSSVITKGPRVMEVLDISDPSTPLAVGLYDVNKLEDGSSVNYVATENNFAYVSVSQSGVKELRILDISEPAEPIEIGSVDLLGPFYDSVQKDNYLYLANGNRLTIVDIMDRKSPKIASSTTLKDSLFLANEIEVEDNYAYISDVWSIRVIDITNPEDPFEVALYKFDQAGDVALVKDYLYALEDWTWKGIMIFEKPE